MLFRLYTVLPTITAQILLHLFSLTLLMDAAYFETCRHSTHSKMCLQYIACPTPMSSKHSPNYLFRTKIKTTLVALLYCCRSTHIQRLWYLEAEQSTTASSGTPNSESESNVQIYYICTFIQAMFLSSNWKEKHCTHLRDRSLTLSSFLEECQSILGLFWWTEAQFLQAQPQCLENAYHSKVTLVKQHMSATD